MYQLLIWAGNYHNHIYTVRSNFVFDVLYLAKPKIKVCVCHCMNRFFSLDRMKVRYSVLQKLLVHLDQNDRKRKINKTMNTI